MKGFNLAKFKKMKEDKDWATLIHEDGHSLSIAKAPLSPVQRKQLEKLEMHEMPKMAKGGKIPHYAEGTDGAGDIPYNSLIPQEQAANAPFGTSEAVSSPSVSNQEPTPEPVQDQTTQNPFPSQPAIQTIAQAQIPGFEEEKAAIAQKGEALAEEGQKEASAIGRIQDATQTLPTQNDIVQGYQQKDANLAQAYAGKEIDPSHYWHDHSKFAAGLGLVLSGLGGSNGAQSIIENGINRDIDAQKNSQNKAYNLWQMNRQALGNDLAANLQTYNQLAIGAKYALDKAAAEAKGPLAKANAAQEIARINQTIQMNNFKLGLMNPSSDAPDPASRVQFLVPPERQGKVTDEINAAKNTVANAPGIMEAFDQAAKEVRPLSGGLQTSGTAFVPGIKSPGQSALQARLGPTFQDVEGTVRQAAMDNLDHNVTPKFGDDDRTIATKRQSLIDYMKSKSAASASKSFGIDLSKFPVTNTAGIGQGRSVIQPGLQYQRQVINGKAYMVPMKGR